MTDTIVILTPAFPSSASDSIWVPSVQLFVRKLKENFPALSVTVLSFNYPFHTDNYSWHEVSVTSFNGLHTKKFKRLMIWRKVWRSLKEIKRNHNIIGLFSFWCGECALVGNYFGRRYGIRHYCWISGMDAKKENRLVRWIRPRATELIAMSTFLVNEFYKNNGIKPTNTIPIGVDPSEFANVAGQRDIDILGAGSLIPFKQYNVFIQIIKNLSTAFPSIKAVICGDGLEMERLQQLVAELQLQDNVILAGEKTHPEVLQYMQRSKVLLHPSSYEGFGAVCIEALYAGAYVISFCDPMQLKIDRWFIAKNTNDMESKAFELLNNPAAEYKPTLLYNMDDAAKAVMNLFINHM